MDRDTAHPGVIEDRDPHPEGMGVQEEYRPTGFGPQRYERVTYLLDAEVVVWIGGGKERPLSRKGRDHLSRLCVERDNPSTSPRRTCR